jgi:hypothetical protein
MVKRLKVQAENKTCDWQCFLRLGRKLMEFGMLQAVRYKGFWSQRVGKTREVSLPNTEGFPLQALGKFSNYLKKDAKKMSKNL